MRISLLLLLPFAGTVLCRPTNDTLLWGAYRPNLYFGLRPRIPQSLMTGLMWFGTHDYQSVGKIRHACDQGDNLDSYTWTEYDTREGGVQVIEDSFNNVKITTEFLKVAGGDHGGSWAARIKGEPIDRSKISRVSPIFYFGLEGLGGLDMETEENENGIPGEIKLSGSSPDLDEFTIRIVDSADNRAVVIGPHADAFQSRLGRTHFAGRPVKEGDIWQANQIISRAILDRARDVIAPYQDPAVGAPDPSFVLQLPDDVYTNSNLFAIQKFFDGPFQFDVFFDSASLKQKLTSATLDQGIPALVEAYGRRFREVFPHPIDYPADKKDSLESFSKAVTSNLVGGVGYFYGTSIVDRKFSYEWDDDEDAVINNAEEKGAKLTDPKALLTATPSRSFFPRGFYWDEGFHLLHIGQWDNDFSLEILKDWIDLIDDDGWVAREQILGEEARSKVPAEFQTQVPNYANPPTLTMAVVAFIERVKRASSGHDNIDADLGLDLGMGTGQAPLGTAQKVTAIESQFVENPELARAFLQEIYKPLKRHYDWFRRTQRGQIKQYSRKARSRTEGYRWRGRSELHVLTSGMDDYPRGPPHAGELHLDLISWVAYFSRTMREIASFVGEKEDEITFAKNERAILDNIEDLHWNEEEQMYCDVDVDDEDESYHVCHKGYLSLFPFLLEQLPPSSPHLGAILDILSDPDHLWSPYGIRSLSASHPEFGKGENYWKGPIWIQMNYLALRALHKTYAAQEGPYQEKAKQIYKELRKNVVDNVVKEYERTGYVWEQYDAISGEGKRSHPFTGWTSLTALTSSSAPMARFGRNSNTSKEQLAGHRQPGRAIGTPFRFGSWLRLHGLDIITMAVMGAVGLGVYFARPAPSRSFPVYFQNGEVVYPQFAYPLRREIVPIWLAALLAFIIPFFFFSLFQVRRRSIDDWLTTNLGLLRSLVTAAVFQVFIKWLIGGLRPHFYAVCQPNIQPGSSPSGIGFASLMYDRKICTGDDKQINDALESMPSGHSTAAWAGFFYLALYFNAQLKVMSAHNPAYWKMILFFAPILGACLISGALTIDEFHNWYDVVAGAMIGICTALVAFRQTFASVFDFRFNHILLPRATSLFHRRPFLPTAGRGPYYTYQPMQEFASYDLPFTREGGWGYGGGEQSVGAPGDATVLSSGMGGAGASGLRAGSAVTGTTGNHIGRGGLGQSGAGPGFGNNNGDGLGHNAVGNDHNAGSVGNVNPAAQQMV
ncbi:hypothetical protein CVT25_015756 [Psilocybe cyanescens]|uniref:Mannosyl-oligosaccharide glucosidase n=1 Tax=Psilocybe cyanescens TaxID=93625 RepID=A0A409WRV1_PSICY|nr:hypothetical protein CVT25_015756 [Psilocybe cyanescens]